MLGISRRGVDNQIADSDERIEQEVRKVVEAPQVIQSARAEWAPIGGNGAEDDVADSAQTGDRAP